ncbi:MAG: ATP-grasp domain-containing protein [Acidobacteriota bacterium]
MRRVLLVATTTGYQVRAFGEAADRLGVKLVFATDRCDQLEDPWWDQALPIRFHEEAASVEVVVGAARTASIDGVVAVGDRPAVLAARVAARLGLAWHSPDAAEAARDKRRTRETLLAAGLPAPSFTVVSRHADAGSLARTLHWPVVLKPLMLSGSRGVIRADSPEAFVQAFARVGRLLASPEVRQLRDPAADDILIEAYIEGREFALEGVIEHGVLHPLAIFDKPDPLEGPFFEETIYTTPSRIGAAEQARLIDAAADAARALGLSHGPIHAECRLGSSGVFVLEVAARPIGGLCARALSFDGPDHDGASLEEVLLRHALGESVTPWRRERRAAGVMMIPIPSAGVFRRASGQAEALAVPGVTELHLTAKPDQQLVPLPEGASYLGFIFARGEDADSVEHALRTAHTRIAFVIDRAVPVS